MPIKIVAKKEGFRRAGVAHFGSQVYPDDHFTEDQLRDLASEPHLDVSVVDKMPGEQAKGKDDKGDEDKKPKGGK